MDAFDAFIWFWLVAIGCTAVFVAGSILLALVAAIACLLPAAAFIAFIVWLGTQWLG